MTALDRFAYRYLNGFDWDGGRSRCGWGEATAIVSCLVGFDGVGLSQLDLPRRAAE